MENLIVMDYSDSSINVYNIDVTKDSAEETIEKLGHNINNCYYMVSPKVTINLNA